MTCQEVQLDLSLYLYGELDFAREEELERHLDQCALCQRAFAREKTWHTALNAEQLDAPLDLLAACRQSLRAAVAAEAAPRARGLSLSWPKFWTISTTRWSAQVALGSFLLFVGFGCGQLMDRHDVSKGLPGVSPVAMSFVGPSSTRVRQVQPDGSGEVRVTVDEIGQQEYIGRPEDEDIRRLLVAAAKDSSDPAMRADCVGILKDQPGTDIRDALLYIARRDPNAAVRIEALEGLRRFSSDTPTRDTLKFVLEHDQAPEVRSEAIDILAPADRSFELSPDMVNTLQRFVRSGQPDDDYARARALQLLREVNASLDVY